MGTLNEAEQNLVIGMVMVTLVEQLQSMDRAPGLNHVVVLEEAHRLLKKPEPTQEGKGNPSAGAAQLFSNLLAEVRKHGEAIVVVDQDPEKLIPDTYKNTNLKVMFRLQSEDDRKRVGSAMGFDEDHLKAAGNLDTFMGFAHVAGMDRPAHVQSAARELVQQEHLGPLATDADVVRHYELMLRTDRSTAESVRPYLACAGCQSACRHRSVATMAAGRSASQARFSALVDELPDKDGPGWSDWFAKTDFELGRILSDLGQERGRDARGCLFIQASRREWKASVDTTQAALAFWRHQPQAIIGDMEEAHER